MNSRSFSVQSLRSNIFEDFNIQEDNFKNHLIRNLETITNLQLEIARLESGNTLKKIEITNLKSDVSINKALAKYELDSCKRKFKGKINELEDALKKSIHEIENLCRENSDLYQNLKINETEVLKLREEVLSYEKKFNNMKKEDKENIMINQIIEDLKDNDGKLKEYSKFKSEFFDTKNLDALLLEEKLETSKKMIYAIEKIIEENKKEYLKEISVSDQKIKNLQAKIEEKEKKLKETEKSLKEVTAHNELIIDDNDKVNKALSAYEYAHSIENKKLLRTFFNQLNECALLFADSIKYFMSIHHKVMKKNQEDFKEFEFSELNSDDSIYDLFQDGFIKKKLKELGDFKIYLKNLRLQLDLFPMINHQIQFN